MKMNKKIIAFKATFSNLVPDSMGAQGVESIIQYFIKAPWQGTANLRQASATAVRALVEIGEPAIDPLMKVLDKPETSDWVKLLVIKFLGKIKVEEKATQEKIIKVLIKKLQSDFLRWSGIMALVKIGEPAIDPLMKALDKETDKWVTDAVITALFQIKVEDKDTREKIINVLIEILQSKYYIQFEAPYIGNFLHLELLMRKKTADWVKVAIIEALARIEVEEKAPQEKIIKVLIKKLQSDFLKEAVIKALGKIGVPAIEHLIEVLKAPYLRIDTNTALKVKEVVIKALVEIGEPAIKPLMKILDKKTSDWVKVAVIEALVRIEVEEEATQEKIINVLIKKIPLAVIHLGDVCPTFQGTDLDYSERQASDWVKEVSIKALGEIGVPAIDPLIKVFKVLDKQETADWVKVAVIEALGRIEVEEKALQEKIVKFLIKKIQSKYFIQFETPFILNVIFLPALFLSCVPIETLIKRLEISLDVKEAAVWALGKIGDPAIDPLIKGLDTNTSLDVKKAFIKALGQIKVKDTVRQEKIINVLIEDLQNHDLRWSAVRSLVEIGDPTIDPLIKVLAKEASNRVKVVVIEALVRIGIEDKGTQEKIIKVLIKKLQSKINDRNVEASVCSALIKIGYRKIRDIESPPEVPEVLDIPQVPELPHCKEELILALKMVGFRNQVIRRILDKRLFLGVQEPMPSGLFSDRVSSFRSFPFEQEPGGIMA